MNGQAVITSLSPETLSWDQALSMFQLRSRSGGHSVRTAENYSWTLTQAVEFFRSTGADRPCAVSAVHIKQLLDADRNRGLSSATIATHYGHLKTFFKNMVSDGFLEKDPTGHISRPKL